MKFVFSNYPYDSHMNTSKKSLNILEKLQNAHNTHNFFCPTSSKTFASIFRKLCNKFFFSTGCLRFFIYSIHCDAFIMSALLESHCLVVFFSRMNLVFILFQELFQSVFLPFFNLNKWLPYFFLLLTSFFSS